jgi:hypothetical protein
MGASPASFTWLTVPGADHYYLYVVDDTTGATVINNPKVLGTSFNLTVPLISGHKYTWWVGAVSTNDLFLTWSNDQEFTNS